MHASFIRQPIEGFTTMTSRHLSIMLAAAVATSTLFGVVACQQYVNIPAQTGDVASANTNGSQVRRLLGESLRGLRSEALREGKYQVILPNGSTPQTYEDVMAIAGENFTWADAKGSGNVVDQLEVRSVRIRGLNASVDVIRSSQPGDMNAPRQLVTVYLRNYVVGGWGTQRVRVWRMSVADALLISAGELLDDNAGSQPSSNRRMDEHQAPIEIAPVEKAPAAQPIVEPMNSQPAAPVAPAPEAEAVQEQTENAGNAENAASAEDNSADQMK